MQDESDDMPPLSKQQHGVWGISGRINAMSDEKLA